MSAKEVLNYLTITGFASDRLSSKKLKSNRKEAIKRNKNLDEIPRDVVRLFKKEAVNKITVIEHKIDNLKQKIESANSELARTYQIHINKLEFIKIGLLCQLDETKPKTLSEWDAFKVKFKYELRSFEDELEDFVGNFI